MTDPVGWTAAQAVGALKEGKIDPGTLVEAALARHAAVDAAVNALPTLAGERARAAARNPALKDTLLGGLPIAVKDLTDVAGLRTTYGSPIFADHVPDVSDVLVERLEANGAIVLGKSNTPEFGAGAQTFNPVFGKTRNPWNTALTCGGSSGGSAVALATGQAWLATGSDLGGSLRIPASFCSVVGLRPSPGVVARAPCALPFDTLSVEGPMGRSAVDVALALDAMAGDHPRDPISRPPPAIPFRQQAQAGGAPGRVAVILDVGFMPLAREIADLVRAAGARFAEHGATVDTIPFDLTEARAVFQTLRAHLYAGNHAEKLAAHRDKLKPDVIWNIEKGLAQTAEEVQAAERARARLYARFTGLFDRYDLVLTPVTPVPPFDVDRRMVDRVGDHRFETYIDWLGFCWAITLMACPAIAMPAGFTRAGLPTGVQMVGPPHGDGRLLAHAHAFELAAGHQDYTPIDPRTPAGGLN